MDQHHLHEYWVSRTLDAPQLVFMWEADRAYFSILWVLGGALMDNMILGIVAAAIFGRFYAYLKEEGGRGLLPASCTGTPPPRIGCPPICPPMRGSISDGEQGQISLKSGQRQL